MIFDKISVDFYADVQVVTANKNVLRDNYKHVGFIRKWYSQNISPDYHLFIDYAPAIDKFIFHAEVDDDKYTSLHDIADKLINPQVYGRVSQRYLIYEGRLCECHGLLANTMDLD